MSHIGHVSFGVLQFQERQPMKSAMGFLTKALVRGLLIVVPVYFAVLLLLKGMKTVAKLVSPFAQMLPEWLPAEDHRRVGRDRHWTWSPGLGRDDRL